MERSAGDVRLRKPGASGWCEAGVLGCELVDRQYRGRGYDVRVAAGRCEGKDGEGWSRARDVYPSDGWVKRYGFEEMCVDKLCLRIPTKHTSSI